LLTTPSTSSHSYKTEELDYYSTWYYQYLRSETLVALKLKLGFAFRVFSVILL
jgi:hypothetical protein